MTANKYKNKKVVYEGINFDSEMEKDFYIYLSKKHKKKYIKIQPKFELQQSFRDRENKLQRAITYTADFQIDNSVYDVKGMVTQQGKMRLKMFKFKYPDLDLKVITKAPKYYTQQTGKEWVDIYELKKIRKARKNATI